MIKKAYVGMLLFGGLWSTDAIAQDVGWITHFKDDCENCFIKRGQKKVQVIPFTVLQVGDRIFVNNKRKVIKLRLYGETQPVEVTAKNSPFKIDKDNQIPSLLNEQWIWIKARFSEWNELTQPIVSGKGTMEVCVNNTESISSEANTIPSVSQPINGSNETEMTPEPPKKLVVPLLKNAFLGAGERPLYLQWYGGLSPYRVLIQQRHNRLLTKISLNSNLKTKVINFEAGKPYRVTIFDAKGQFFMGGFKAIAPTKIPSVLLNADLVAKLLPHNLQKTLQATWLAMQEDDKWVFEAYQQTAQVVDYLPAQLLKKALVLKKQQTHLCNRDGHG